MLCDKCLAALQNPPGTGLWTSSQGASATVLTIDTVPQAIASNSTPHHQSILALRDSAQRDCYVCTRLWKRLEGRAQQSLLSSDSVADLHVPATQSLFLGPVLSESLEKDANAPSAPTFRWNFSISEGRFLRAPEGNTSWTVPVHAVPAGSVNEGEILSNSTSSEESWAFAVHSFENCLHNHGNCKVKMDTNWLPNRLLRVTDVAESGFICLVDSNEIQPTPYIALSHCWGSTKFLELTADTLDSLKRGIEVSRLPQTFQDCVTVAQKLKISYIWIDSLCIIQDDADDWLREALQMDQVYANSICNVCATGSSDTSQGLFTKREPAQFRPVHVMIRWEGHERLYQIIDNQFWKEHVEGAPLNKRAWVVQEHLLAPRQLHFGNSQVLWECLESNAAEQYPNGVPEFLSTLEESPFNLTPPGSLEFEPVAKRSWILAKWRWIIEEYSQAALTYRKDKNIAFSGIAKRFEKVLQEKTIAGLWETNIEFSLLWHFNPRGGNKYPSPRPEAPRPPSFSWMSIDGRVSADTGVDRDSVDDLLARVLDVEGYTDSGSLVGGSLRIQGSLVRLRLHQISHVPLWNVSVWEKYEGMETGDWSQISFCKWANLDIECDFTAPLYGLPIKFGSLQGNSQVLGLVIRETGVRKGEYERIGIFWAVGEEMAEFVHFSRHNTDEDTYPCEIYTAETRRHTLTIV